MGGIGKAEKVREPHHPKLGLQMVKLESHEDEPANIFSPETKALIKGLSDSPESLQLKAEILSAANELKRGYSSGSAGGSVLGGPPEMSADPMPALSDQVPPPPNQGVPSTPAPSLPPPLKETLVPEMTTLEADMKSRMEQHAKALEKALTNEFLEKKRQAEIDLDMEMDLKRQKRMRDLEEELKEQADMKRATLASLDIQLAERMQLVADEQTMLDELKDKSIDVRRRLEEESKKMQELQELQLKSAEPTTPAEPPQTPAPAHDKEAMKDKLRQKLQDTVQKKQNQSELASSAHTPLASVAAPTPSAHVEVPAVPTGPRDGGIVPMTDMRFTSSTHPAAWQFLYRLTRKPDQCDKSIYDAWHAGGTKRDVLLRDFVCRCYTPTDDFTKNKAKLQALITLRNTSKSWRRNLQGFSWHTEDEMKSQLGWPETKVEGAVKYCTKRKLTKKCLYDATALKYLVQVRDDIEAGDERLRVLEQEMKDWGIFDTDFSLGDVLGDDDPTENSADSNSKPTKKKVDFPTIEGEETIVEYIGAYKKQCLSKKALLKSVRERLERDGSTGHEKDLKNLEESAGKLNELYQEMGAIEVGPKGREKGAFAVCCEKIRVECINFGNIHAQVKTFFTKTSAKCKSKPKPEDDDHGKP
eukprot:s597_g11.t1